MHSALKRIRRAGALCAALAASLVLVSCGGGDEAPTQGADSSATGQEAGVTGTMQQANRRARAWDRKGVTALAVDRNGQSVGAVGSDGRVRLLRAKDAHERSSFAGHAGAPATGALFSADGRRMITVGRDSVAYVWDVATGQKLLTLRGHEHAIRTVAASSEAGLIATAGEETRVMLWDASTGKLKRVLGGGRDFVNSVAFSPDGKQVAAGDAAARITVWDVATGRILQTLSGHSDEVNAVAFSPDGKLVASASEDGRVMLWTAGGGQAPMALDTQRAAVRTVAFSADGTAVAAGTAAGAIVVWDVRSRQVIRSLSTSGGPVNTLAFDARDNGLLFAGGGDNRVVLWDLAQGVAR